MQFYNTYNMKRIVYLFALLALMVSCEEPDPHRAAMEQYAKEHIATPDTYKFNYMGIEKEYKYVNELYTLRKGLEEQMAKAADKAAYQDQIDKIDALFPEVGYDVACYEYSLYFWYMGGQTGKMKLEGVVLARYDADGNLLVMTMDPDSLPTYPALQMLRDQGKL